ncbi:MAG: Flp pilus assembly protein CpaB [Rhodospirillales bacterium]|nr:Flp pilus assembly protein CpaB [Rhodospirillales bacterium]
MSLRLIVVALILTAALALGSIAWRASQPVHPVTSVSAPTRPPPPLMLSYLSAAHALPAGTLARDEDYAVKKAISGTVPAGAVMDTPEARGSMRGALIRHYIDAGAPITAADLLRPRDRGFLAAVLAPNTRALAIGVDAVSGVAGLIWPGDRVDVILTQQNDRAGAGQRVLAETVLHDVRVIAVDQEIVQGASPLSSVAGRLARTVTLQVAAQEAERLAVAQRLGRLELAIRAAADAAGPGSDADHTVYGADVSPALASPAAPPAARVQVIQGSQRSEVMFP